MVDFIREKILFKIFKKEGFIGQLINKLFTKEIINYIIFGVLTTLVNWAVYTLFVKLVFPVPSDFQITVSNAVAWVAGVLFAYITNKLFVFESRSFAPLLILRELVSFVAARGITGVLEIFGVPALVKLGLNQDLFGVAGAVAKILVSIIVIILNYVFSKLIVFKRNKNEID